MGDTSDEIRHEMEIYDGALEDAAKLCEEMRPLDPTNSHYKLLTNTALLIRAHKWTEDRTLAERVNQMTKGRLP